MSSPSPSPPPSSSSIGRSLQATAATKMDTTTTSKSGAAADCNKAALRSAPSGCSLVSLTSLGTCATSARISSESTEQKQQTQHHHHERAMCDNLPTSMLTSHPCGHTHSQTSCAHECPGHVNVLVQQHDNRGMHHLHDMTQAQHRLVGVTNQAATLNVVGNLHAHKHHLVKAASSQVPNSPQQNCLPDQQQAGAAGATLKSLIRDGTCSRSLGATPDLTMNVSSGFGGATTCSAISVHQHQQHIQQQPHQELNLHCQQSATQPQQIELQPQQTAPPGQTQLHFEDLIETQLPLTSADTSKMSGHHLVGKSVVFSLPPPAGDNGAVDVDIILGHPH
ncbi:hypothetical protein BIW11_12413 [Tropilaelaps mercedesae]|uniref:Uncharacterized protein n=1 Tax=Tropilaelaps mercedesae TaxID=418985 RepID=A0A1V9X6G6_9ACAR|nr:hypothetical protein BIW11_12413 [Tropilaelaps mercedesae]